MRRRCIRPIFKRPKIRCREKREEKSNGSANVTRSIAAKTESSLRRLLAEIGSDQESLIRYADELAEAGLTAVANILMEAAADALPGSAFCPYAETDVHNFNSWQASYQRRQLMLSGRWAPPRSRRIDS